MATEPSEVKEFEAAVTAALEPIYKRIHEFEEAKGKLECLEETVKHHAKHFAKMAKHFAKHFPALEEEESEEDGNPGEDEAAEEGNKKDSKKVDLEAVTDSLRKDFEAKLNAVNENIVKLFSAAGQKGKVVAASANDGTTKTEKKDDDSDKNFEAIVRPARKEFKARTDIPLSKRADEWEKTYQGLCVAHEAKYFDYIERQKTGKAESFE